MYEHNEQSGLLNTICSFPLVLILLATLSLPAQSNNSVRLTEGKPELIIDNKTYPPFAYMSYLGEDRYYREISQSGIHIYNLPAYLGERGINSTSGIGAFRKPIWIGENDYDFSSLIYDFEEIIGADEKAKVIVRLYLDPPLWWELSNPEASSQLPGGGTFRQSFTSDVWKNQTGKVLEACLDWLQNSPYAKHFIGVHVASGFTEEWFYHPKQYDNINPVRRIAFQQWLRKNYKNENALRKAWNDKGVTFEDAYLANINEEARKEWRDPDHDMNYVDTFRFHSEVMVDNIAYFCKIVKEKSAGKLLTGAFYGYHYYVTDPRRGHGALAKLLDCPDLDYLSSPNVYNRVLGEDWPPMMAIQSLRLHGKLFLVENDTRTSLTTLLKDRSEGIAPVGQYETGVWVGPEEMDVSESFLWKNTARMLAYGYGGWWFDMWGGWFSSPQLLNVLEKTQELHSKYAPEKVGKMKSEVLVLVDEELSFWDTSYGTLTESILSNRYPLAKTGTSHDLFLRTDLNAIDTEQYKVIWLMGVLNLNKSETRNIEEWNNKGATVIWTSQNGTKVFKEKKEYFFKGKLKWKESEIRSILKNAGVHIYNSDGDVFYIGYNWLGIHTVEGGERTINFPFSAQIIDPLTNEIMSESTERLKLTMKPKSTILLRVNPLQS